jgi:hypothetical protein
LDYVTAFKHIRDDRGPSHPCEIRLAREHGLNDQRRSTGKHRVDFQSVLFEKPRFIGNQERQTVIRDRRIREFYFVERSRGWNAPLMEVID